MNAADAAEDYRYTRIFMRYLQLLLFRTTLQELRANNKNTINLLTILADDYSEVAHAIVQTIDDHLHNVSIDFDSTYCTLRLSILCCLVDELLHLSIQCEEIMIVIKLVPLL